MNDTIIVLIPKVKVPVKTTKLMSISLCNVLVKIMTKALTNRLKLVFDEIISESQSAFIPECLITDNVMIGFEIGHYLKRKRQGIWSLASLKLICPKLMIGWSGISLNMML